MNGVVPADVTDRLGRPGAYSLVAGFFVAVVAAWALYWVGGPLGAAGGVALLAVWVATTPQFAFAMGQVALVASAGRIGDPQFVLVEVALFAVLVTPPHRSRTDWPIVAATPVAALAFGGLAWWTQTTWNRTGLTAAVVLGAIATAAYLGHRYELVGLGRVRS
ncbi:hypothetical protein BV210_05840 [Halorientalis sp. IM1011]|uniref:hypothetical protein n=1 Tax=Halorientalis sp. IM1011 TaxID=1932360 RepID=UPI00097CD70E|nr:hypothetical protein [Halorientalis sp. IM1011]AQL42263.1 hypothetical protein BV210_05840 [Halorientalis sp. IM1011]